LRRFGLLELRVFLQGWFLEAVRWPQEPQDEMGRFWRLVGLTEAALVILGLYVSGALPFRG
jgi:hypothetical protein